MSVTIFSTHMLDLNAKKPNYLFHNKEIVSDSEITDILKTFFNQSPHTLYKSMQHRAYGIQYLQSPDISKQWIPTLIKIALILHPDDDINLILHDKDTNDSKYHKDIYVTSESDKKELIGDTAINHSRCNIIFFQHGTNAITNILKGSTPYPDDLVSFILSKPLLEAHTNNLILNSYLFMDMRY